MMNLTASCDVVVDKILSSISSEHGDYLQELNDRFREAASPEGYDVCNGKIYRLGEIGE